MHDDTPFLRAVCEAPFDDGPRLVWADALDERGECARAEFIRLQCELARLGYDGPLMIRTARLQAASHQPAQHPLVDRAARLLSEYATAWCRGMGVDAALAYEWEWSRGLVGSVTLTAAQFFGGPCGRCGGTGDVAPPAMRRHQLGGSRRVPSTRCPDCHDTGHVEGLAAALFAAAPVTEVRLSDREPDSIGNGRLAWWYTDPDWRRLGLHQHHWLPVELRPYLAGRISEPVDEPRPGVCGFDYGDSFAGTDGVGLARADLSAACVALGRARAKLPALARVVIPVPRA
jgi:uncharacterized protein (TIGR02996 family)